MNIDDDDILTEENLLDIEKAEKEWERPRIIIPIYICHQSINEYNTEVDNYYRNQNQNQININQYDINNQYNINNQQQNNYNRSITLMNPNYQTLLNIDKDKNKDNKVEDVLVLPNQEEI